MIGSKSIFRGLRTSIGTSSLKHFFSSSYSPSKKIFNFDEYNVFEPEKYGLPKDFLFTNFSELKGWGCKVPQAQLLQYLDLIGGGVIGHETPDCSLTSVRNSKKKLISTIDFFYPLVHDPYIQGRIACCNVLSDLYAMAITDIDTVLMVLGVSNKMNDLERKVTTSLMIKGFDDTAQEAGSNVSGGQTVINPVPMIGGAAFSVLREGEYIMPNSAHPGDVILLTKPLGTQIVVNVHQWLKTGHPRWQKALNFVKEADVERAYTLAMKSMGTLNLLAASLMRKYKAKSATDVTGFGILGHASYLAKAIKQNVDFRIHSLPVFAKMSLLDKTTINFKFMEGTSAETSGGLFICISKENAQPFIEEMRSLNQYCFEIGEVIQGENKAFLEKDLKIIDV